MNEEEKSAWPARLVVQAAQMGITIQPNVAQTVIAGVDIRSELDFMRALPTLISECVNVQHGGDERLRKALQQYRKEESETPEERFKSVSSGPRGSS